MKKTTKIRYHDGKIVTSLPENTVFVFGSNGKGLHNAGAAKTAATYFGAHYGQARYTQGQSYGIDTMSGEEAITEQLLVFWVNCKANSKTDYYVTRVGCGIAGYTDAQMAIHFLEAGLHKLPNLIFHPEWRMWLEAVWVKSNV